MEMFVEDEDLGVLNTFFKCTLGHLYTWRLSRNQLET